MIKPLRAHNDVINSPKYETGSPKYTLQFINYHITFINNPMQDISEMFIWIAWLPPQNNYKKKYIMNMILAISKKQSRKYKLNTITDLNVLWHDEI